MEKVALKKNILFMVQLPPPIHGAALRNKSLLESSQVSDRFSVSCLPLKFVDELKQIGSFSFRKFWLMITYTVRLIYTLATKKIDLVYFTMSPSGGAFYRDCFFMVFIKLFRKKTILHFRKQGIRDTGKMKLGKKLLEFVFKDSVIVCLSQYQAAEILPYYRGTPHIVPNGIKVEFQHLYNGNANGNGKTRIIFLSNLMLKKGIKELIDALALVHQNNLEFEAVIVGAENDLTYAQVQAMIDKAKLTAHTTVLGPRYGSEKFKELVKSDIFVFPTYFELFPGVVLEAMQFGKAIVTTFEGSIPEMIDTGVNGVLVEQRNAASLAAAIIDLIEDPVKRRRLGLEARKKFFDKFQLQTFEKNMVEVFEKTLC